MNKKLLPYEVYVVMLPEEEDVVAAIETELEMKDYKIIDFDRPFLYVVGMVSIKEAFPKALRAVNKDGITEFYIL